MSVGSLPLYIRANNEIAALLLTVWAIYFYLKEAISQRDRASVLAYRSQVTGSSDLSGMN